MKQALRIMMAMMLVATVIGGAFVSPVAASSHDQTNEIDDQDADADDDSQAQNTNQQQNQAGAVNVGAQVGGVQADVL